MRIGMTILIALAVFTWVTFGFSGTAFGLDVKEEAKDLKEKGGELVDKGVEKSKELLKEGKETFTDKGFWEKVPPYAALPAALVVGILLGFFLGRGGKKKEGRK